MTHEADIRRFSDSLTVAIGLYVLVFIAIPLFAYWVKK
jgi:cbb3-type cytochrome oxidase subunit 3